MNLNFPAFIFFFENLQLNQLQLLIEYLDSGTTEKIEKKMEEQKHENTSSGGKGIFDNLINILVVIIFKKILRHVIN